MNNITTQQVCRFTITDVESSKKAVWKITGEKALNRTFDWIIDSLENYNMLYNIFYVDYKAMRKDLDEGLYLFYKDMTFDFKPIDVTDGSDLQEFDENDLSQMIEVEEAWDMSEEDF